jgi:hypothetical protein
MDVLFALFYVNFKILTQVCRWDGEKEVTQVKLCYRYEISKKNSLPPDITHIITKIAENDKQHIAYIAE